jgi:hypothetical protein
VGGRHCGAKNWQPDCCFRRRLVGDGDWPPGLVWCCRSRPASTMNFLEPAFVRVHLHINGNLDISAELQVQPFITKEAFLSAASHKLNLSSNATKACVGGWGESGALRLLACLRTCVVATWRPHSVALAREACATIRDQHHRCHHTPPATGFCLGEGGCSQECAHMC